MKMTNGDDRENYCWQMHVWQNNTCVALSARHVAAVSRSIITIFLCREISRHEVKYSYLPSLPVSLLFYRLWLCFLSFSFRLSFISFLFSLLLFLFHKFGFHCFIFLSFSIFFRSPFLPAVLCFFLQFSVPNISFPSSLFPFLPILVHFILPLPSFFLSICSSIYIILDFLYTSFSIPVPSFFRFISFYLFAFLYSVTLTLLLSPALFSFLLFTLPFRVFHQFFLLFLHSFSLFHFLFFFISLSFYRPCPVLPALLSFRTFPPTSTE